jgi:hypothetical protein
MAICENVTVRRRFLKKNKNWQSATAPPKIKTGPDLFLFLLPLSQA